MVADGQAGAVDVAPRRSNRGGRWWSVTSRHIRRPLRSTRRRTGVPSGIVPPPHYPTATHRKSSGLGLSSATASFTITRSMPPASESADAVRLRISCSPAVNARGRISRLTASRIAMRPLPQGHDDVRALDRAVGIGADDVAQHVSFRQDPHHAPGLHDRE